MSEDNMLMSNTIKPRRTQLKAPYVRRRQFKTVKG